MNANTIKTYNSYNFGFSYDLTDQHLKHFIKLFQKPSKTADSVLGGRTSVLFGEIDEIGSVAIKYYHRGGFIRHFIKKRYLKCGKTRCQIEYEILNKALHLGINVPEPIVYAYRGIPFYKAWLVTRAVKQHQTLALLSLKDAEKAFSLMEKIVDFVSVLIQNKILHVDLHPGNILVDKYFRIFLIDFDKAHFSCLNKDKLIDKYINRWKRAVVKHELPEMLWKIMRTELRKAVK